MICKICIDLDSDNWDIRFYKSGEEIDIRNINRNHGTILKRRLKDVWKWCRGELKHAKPVGKPIEITRCCMTCKGYDYETELCKTRILHAARSEMCPLYEIHPAVAEEIEKGTMVMK